MFKTGFPSFSTWLHCDIYFMHMGMPYIYIYIYIHVCTYHQLWLHWKLLSRFASRWRGDWSDSRSVLRTNDLRFMIYIYIYIYKRLVPCADGGTCVHDKVLLGRTTMLVCLRRCLQRCFRWSRCRGFRWSRCSRCAHRRSRCLRCPTRCASHPNLWLQESHVSCTLKLWLRSLPMQDACRDIYIYLKHGHPDPYFSSVLNENHWLSSIYHEKPHIYIYICSFQNVGVTCESKLILVITSWSCHTELYPYIIYIYIMLIPHDSFI